MSKSEDTSMRIIKKASCKTLSGKSVNTPSFLLAVLKHLKLVRPMKNKQRHHERLNPKPFMDQMEKLMSSSPAAKPKGATKKTVRKAPRKKTTVKKDAQTPGSWVTLV